MERTRFLAAARRGPARSILPMACCVPVDRLAACIMRLALSLLLLAATPASASGEAKFDPGNVSVVDAINCHVDAPTYNGFAMAVGGEDNLSSRLGWRKVLGRKLINGLEVWSLA